jgi:hypothetical protein
LPWSATPHTEPDGNGDWDREISNNVIRPENDCYECRTNERDADQSID